MGVSEEKMQMRQALNSLILTFQMTHILYISDNLTLDSVLNFNQSFLSHTISCQVDVKNTTQTHEKQNNHPVCSCKSLNVQGLGWIVGFSF